MQTAYMAYLLAKNIHCPKSKVYWDTFQKVFTLGLFAKQSTFLKAKVKPEANILAGSVG